MGVIGKSGVIHSKFLGQDTEATLLTVAAIGGSIGAWAGMRVWHHKTMHKKFKYGIPVIIIMQIALVVYLHAMI